MIYAIALALLVGVVGFSVNRVFPYSIPISMLYVEKHGYFYFVILATLIPIIALYFWGRRNSVGRSFAYPLAFCLSGLFLFPVTDFAIHTLFAILFMGASILLALKIGAALASNVILLAAAVSFLSLSLLIGDNDTAIAIAECLIMGTCLFAIHCDYYKKSYSLPASVRLSGILQKLLLGKTAAIEILLATVVFSLIKSLGMLEVPFYLAPLMLISLYFSLKWSFDGYRVFHVRTAAILLGIFAVPLLLVAVGLSSSGGHLRWGIPLAMVAVSVFVFLYDTFLEDFFLE